ncbi:hypothetical protein BV20DRAFT_481329 [Pilatotrama ljubarskyi]|nr:hypothetical protein BV20DRAFT_481329 [Pilatotrama ljubarskyi]
MRSPTYNTGCADVKYLLSTRAMSSRGSTYQYFKSNHQTRYRHHWLAGEDPSTSSGRCTSTYLNSKGRPRQPTTHPTIIHCGRHGRLHNFTTICSPDLTLGR